LGLLPLQRRRLPWPGVKPLGAVQSRVENFDVYGAVEPTTAESFCLELPYLNATNCQILLNAFAPGDQESLPLVLRENGSWHTAKSLVIPHPVVCLFVPPYSPERNPLERLWQDVKQQLAWVVAPALHELAHRVAIIITHYSSAAIRSLTAYPSWVHAVKTVCS
jgi:transposase